MRLPWWGFAGPLTLFLLLALGLRRPRPLLDGCPVPKTDSRQHGKTASRPTSAFLLAAQHAQRSVRGGANGRPARVLTLAAECGLDTEGPVESRTRKVAVVGERHSGAPSKGRVSRTRGCGLHARPQPWRTVGVAMGATAWVLGHPRLGAPLPFTRPAVLSCWHMPSRGGSVQQQQQLAATAVVCASPHGGVGSPPTRPPCPP